MKAKGDGGLILLQAKGPSAAWDATPRIFACCMIWEVVAVGSLSAKSMKLLDCSEVSTLETGAIAR